jgi:hypothetical protein
MHQVYNQKMIKRKNMKIQYKLLTLAMAFIMTATCVHAGNPDRQGESGAAELLLNPWARSGGLHTLNTSSVTGIEAMRLNVAGIGRISGKELVVSSTRLYEGSDINLNALGYGQKVGSNGAISVSLMSVDFGDNIVTTENNPSGTGANINASFFNIGIGYSYTYDNKISVGILFRGISESLPDVSATGFAIDAGVQYVSGENDNFRLGISLRNVGSPMSFSGEGLSFQGDNPGDGTFQLTFDQRAEGFELPSMLNIGLSYDFYFGDKIMLRGIGNFTSNAFSRDQLGVGAEFIFNERFTLRGAYKTELGEIGDRANVYSGLAFGASIELPFSAALNNKIGVDYGYRATNPFRGTHNVSVRLSF